MAIKRVLTSVLLAALRAYDISVLVPEVDVFNVPLEAHLVEIFVTITASLPRVAILFGRRGCGGRPVRRGH